MTETWFENSPSAFIRRAASTLAEAKVDPKLSARDEESPPWESPRPSLRFFNEEEKESGRRKDHLEIYTDGAKTKDGRCGAAFTIPSRSITHSVSLAGCPAVLSCELTAIYLAMKWIAENRKGKKMVITDSKQALKEICAVGGRKAGHLVESIQRMWQILKEDGEEVEFVWVKGHSGVSGNEEADSAAKAALLQPQNLSIRPEPTDLSEKLQKYVVGKWQAKWSTPATKCGKFYASHTPEVRLKPFLSSENSKEEKIISKIRLDRLDLNERKFKEGKRHPTSLCDGCGTAENVQHVLLECPLYEEEREAMSRSIDAPLRLAVLLDSSKEDSRKALLQFVKASGILSRSELHSEHTPSAEE